MRLGMGEIVVVLVLALLFFGPSKLPQLGASLGQALKSFKKGLNSLHEDADAEAPPPVREEQTRLPVDPSANASTTTAEQKPTAAVAGQRPS
jgi:sec-independent protein translocase protein TatA